MQYVYVNVIEFVCCFVYVFDGSYVSVYLYINIIFINAFSCF